jgi:AraC-like DNA-binding protein
MAGAGRLAVCAREVERLSSLAASLDPPCVGSRLEGVAASAVITLVDHFRSLQRLSVMGGDETCQLSLRPLARGTTDFVLASLADARDLQDAMHRVARAYNVIHGGSFNRVEQRRDRLIYVIDDTAFPYAFAPGAGTSHAVVEGVLIFLHAMLSIAIGEDLTSALRTVRTRRPVRRAPDGLLSFWTTPVRCKAEVYALEFDAAVAGRPVREAAEGVTNTSAVYDHVIAMITAREATTSAVDFPARVGETIAGGTIEQRNVARHLGVSIATLRRRLTQSSVSFRDLRAEVLSMTAKTLLSERRHANDVAEVLGFSDGRSFARAFKSWNGITPTAFRAAQVGDARD